MIRVYDATEKLFNHNGIKVLNPLFAEITKVKNGDYYIDLEDVIDNLDYYQKGMIIRVDTPWNRADKVQGFRCDNPVIKNNRISCRAWHLFYDSENYIINNATAKDKNCNDALNHYNDNTDIASPFTVISDIGTLKDTQAIRKSLFGVFTELLNVYEGNWIRDNFTLKIWSSIEQDIGVVLAYNKNITDIKVDENWDNVCTKILPFVKEGEEEITLDEIYVETSEVLYDIPYTKVVEFKYEEKEGEVAPSSKEEWQEWLHGQSLIYLEQNKYPKVNYSVSAKLDNISDVGDIVYIKHPKIISESKLRTEVLSVKYDPIKSRYTSIEFGNFKREIKNLVTEVASIIETDINAKTAEGNALLKAELNEATTAINTVLSASNVINNGNEILVVDKLPKEEAVYCLKVNSAGIGFSNTGINGTFDSAWTIDGTLNMQAINVINLTASLIKGGTLKLGGVNNTSGDLELYDNSNRLMCKMNSSGLTVYDVSGNYYVKLNAEEGFAGFKKSKIEGVPDEKIYWADGDVFRMKNAEVENEIKIAGKIKIVPVSTADNVGVGFVALA